MGNYGGHMPIDVNGNGGDRDNHGQGNIHGNVGKINNFGDINNNMAGNQTVVAGNMKDSSASASEGANVSNNQRRR